MFDDGGVVAAADVLIDMLAEVVDVLAADDPSALDLAGQLQRLRAFGRQIERLEAERVRLVGVAERSGALADDGAATATAWLRRHSTLTANQAADRARLARCLQRLPVIADAFAAGDLGIAHAIQIDRLACDIGVDQIAAVQHELVEAAGRLRDVAEFTKLCAGWRHALRPDANDAADDRAYRNRRLNHASTLDGVFHLSGQFDAEGGATIAAALNAYTHHDPPDTPPELRRTIQQRRADALVDIARTALGCADAPQVAGAKPRIVVRVNLADLISHPAHPHHHRLPGSHHRCRCGGSVSPPTVDWTGPIGPQLLERLLDDATITRVVLDSDGQPLDVGTATRTWPTAIRAAITERDRGCRFDPCDRPAEWCDIDHVVPYSQGGRTSVDKRHPVMSPPPPRQTPSWVVADPTPRQHRHLDPPRRPTTHRPAPTPHRPPPPHPPPRRHHRRHRGRPTSHRGRPGRRGQQTTQPRFPTTRGLGSDRCWRFPRHLPSQPRTTPARRPPTTSRSIIRLRPRRRRTPVTAGNPRRRTRRRGTPFGARRARTARGGQANVVCGGEHARAWSRHHLGQSSHHSSGGGSDTTVAAD
jgi:hypothetical protein